MRKKGFFGLVAGMLLGAAFAVVALFVISGRGSTTGLSDGASLWLTSPFGEVMEFVPPWDEPGRLPDRIALTFSEDPATTLSVAWRTDTTVSRGLVMVAPADASPDFPERAATFEAELEYVDLSQADGERVRANFHSATLRDLEPGTLYAYRVGDGEIWSEWFQTRTADERSAPFSFLYFGDAQNDLYSMWSRTVRAAFSEAPDVRFMIHAGDLVNSGHRDTEWGEWFEAGGWLFGMLPSIPVPGNHEYRGLTPDDPERRLSLQWRPQFVLPMNGLPGLEETSYFVDYQGVRIVGLNSNEMLVEQAAWLDSVLTGNNNRWTVATFHHPVFSSSVGRDNEELRAAWKPVFDRHRVDLVLQGHDHTYARGRDVNVSAGVSARDSWSGTVYVNSVSGPKMYDIKDERWQDYGATMERAAENTQLFQVIHIDGDTLRYEAFTATGERYDGFNLVKSSGGPNTFVELVGADEPERTISADLR